MNRLRTSVTEALVRNPVGDVAFTFGFSSGWTDRPFSTNVRVQAPRRDNKVAVSMAVNEAHPGFSRAIARVKGLDDRRAVHEVIEKMEHALFDFAAMPERVHIGVIGNMGRLALAHGLRQINLTHPSIMEQLHPVLVEYDARTTQQYSNIHAFILNQSAQPVPVPA